VHLLFQLEKKKSLCANALSFLLEHHAFTLGPYEPTE